MDKETKDVIKPLIECLASITEKQALILQLLAMKLPDISEDERSKLRDSAKANEQNAQTFRQSLKTSG